MPKIKTNYKAKEKRKEKKKTKKITFTLSSTFGTEMCSYTIIQCEYAVFLNRFIPFRLYYGRVSDLNFITQRFLVGVCVCIQLALVPNTVNRVCSMCLCVSFENIHCIALTVHKQLRWTAGVCVFFFHYYYLGSTFSNSFIMSAQNECARQYEYLRKFMENHTCELSLSCDQNRIPSN